MKILNRSVSKGFTLIELLVVVAIIAILASIAVPIISKALENAKKAQARTEIRTIETAVRAYYNEYSKYPQGSGQPDKKYVGSARSGTSVVPVNTELINILRAIDATGNAGHVGNIKRIVFMEVPDGSLDTKSNFVDPWQEAYQIVIDTDFNNTVSAGSPYNDIKNRQVAVWSFGAGGDATKTNDHLKSWR